LDIFQSLFGVRIINGGSGNDNCREGSDRHY
jgi:hypothetical protein